MKTYLKAATGCSAVYLSKSATLWSNTGSCSGWSQIELDSDAECFEWTGFCGGSTCISAADEVGYSMAFIKGVSTAGYDNVRIQYDVLPEDLDGKDDDHCYVKYSTNNGGSWITVGDHTTNNLFETDVLEYCNNAADNNPYFGVKFETVDASNKCCDYCSWDNMKVIADFIPTPRPTLTPTKRPTATPTTMPTAAPTVSPTSPTAIPSKTPTKSPTKNPTGGPTNDPSNDPTADPTADPTNDPSVDPTIDPTTDPTSDPSIDPTIDPTHDPTTNPTKHPTKSPTFRSGEVGGEGEGGDSSDINTDINSNTTRVQNDTILANTGSVSGILVIVVGALSVLFCALIGVYFCCRYSKKRRSKITMDLFTDINQHSKVTSVSGMDSGLSGDDRAINGGTQISMTNINTAENNKFIDGKMVQISMKNNSNCNGEELAMAKGRESRHLHDMILDVHSDHVHVHGEGNKLNNNDEVIQSDFVTKQFVVNADEWSECSDDDVLSATNDNCITKGNDINSDNEDSVDNLENNAVELQEGGGGGIDDDFDIDIINQVMTPHGGTDIIIGGDNINGNSGDSVELQEGGVGVGVGGVSDNFDFDITCGGDDIIIGGDDDDDVVNMTDYGDYNINENDEDLMNDLMNDNEDSVDKLEEGGASDDDSDILKQIQMMTPGGGKGAIFIDDEDENDDDLLDDINMNGVNNFTTTLQ